MSLIRTLAVAGTLALLGAPAFAASFVSGNINTNASAFLGIAGPGHQLPGTVDSRNANIGAPTGTVKAFQAKASESGAGNNSVTTTSDAMATWNSANSGSFISTTTRTMILPTRSHNLTFAQSTNLDQSLTDSQPAFDYQFKADGTDNLFSLNYSVALTGDNGPGEPGMGGWIIDITEDGKDLTFQHLSDGAVSSANFTQALSAGHTYDIQLRNNEGLLVPDTDFHNIVSQDTSTFSWSVTGSATGGGGGTGGVPEPATWAMLILGFGLTGAAQRRMKATQRFA